MCICPELEQIVGLSCEKKSGKDWNLSSQNDWIDLKGDSVNLIHVVVNVIHNSII